MPVSDFISLVEGSPMMNRPAVRQASPVQVGADGIAISHDGKRLYYCPLSSWALYSVDTEALTNQEMTDETVAKTVVYE
jgi:sugar lactone lactonase YvrE